MSNGFACYASASSEAPVCAKANGTRCQINADCLSGRCLDFFPDKDRDGYGVNFGAYKQCVPQAFTMQLGFVHAHPSGRTDCNDNNALVNPGSSVFRTVPIPGKTTNRYDYNCRQGDELQNNSSDYWRPLPGQDADVPECGETRQIWEGWENCDSGCVSDCNGRFNETCEAACDCEEIYDCDNSVSFSCQDACEDGDDFRIEEDNCNCNRCGYEDRCESPWGDSCSGSPTIETTCRARCDSKTRVETQGCR